MSFTRAFLHAQWRALKRGLAQKGRSAHRYALKSINYMGNIFKYWIPQEQSSLHEFSERTALYPAFQLHPIRGNVSRHALSKLHQQVTLRWLAANIITGISGGLLMAIALYVPMQGQISFAEFPKFIDQMGFFSSIFERKEDIAPKENRLIDSAPLNIIRQVFKGTIPAKIGKQQINQNTTLIRLITPLSAAHVGQKIPPFNTKTLLSPQKIGSPKPKQPEPITTSEDEDIRFILQKFPSNYSSALWENSPSFSEAQIFHQVILASTGRSQDKNFDNAQEELANTLTIPVQTSKTASEYTLRKSDSQYPILDTQILPENVSVHEKNSLSDRIVSKVLIIHAKDDLEKILKDNHASPEMIKDMLQALGGQQTLRKLKEGDRVEIVLETLPGDTQHTPIRVTLFDERGELYAIVALNDNQKITPVVLSEEEIQTTKKLLAQRSAAEGKNDRSFHAPLYNSLYATVLNNNLPLSLIGDLIRIFSSDLNFQKPMSGAKTLDVLYSEAETGADGRPEILYANFGIGNKHFEVYRYISPKNLSTSYFNPRGESLNKFLLRKPLVQGNVSSQFGLRLHPILRYKRMHTGTDWVAPTGTPILAAADGVVARAAWSGGYGRRVELKHRNGYTSTYSHLSGIAKGIKAGVNVSQGQVIGYLGSTGLSTGPHLHYEVLINGRFMDPMKVKLPQGQGGDSALPSDFSMQKNKIDALLRRSDTPTQASEKS
jgi:murein DD-endopeptidase MepM/ murein hydrolase activator NlpD